MPRGKFYCCECETEIVRGSEIWEEVEGFERKRRGGGTNHLALRKPTGRVMCISCMHRAAAGVDRGQTDMFEENLR